MSASGELVVVAGATGYLGRYLVRELAERGYRVRAIVRDEGRARQPGSYGAPSLDGLASEFAVGDVTAAGFRRGLCADADRVVSALGVTRQRADPWDVDFLANLGLLEEAERAGAQSLLYVGVMHAQIGRSMMLRAKFAFMQALRRSAVTPQIVNPSGFFSDVSEFLDMARHGLIVLPPGPPVRIAPIHAADLARFCVDRLPEGAGTWDVGGPDVLTYREIAELARNAVGRDCRIWALPRWPLKTAVWAARRWGGQAQILAEFFAEGLTHDAIGQRTGTQHLAGHFASLEAARRMEGRP